MKKTIMNVFLLSAVFLFVSCKKDGAAPVSEISPPPATAIQKEEPGSSAEESFDEAKVATMEKALIACNEEWRSEINEQNNSEEKKLIAIGIVGKECLSIERVKILKTILSAYKNNMNKKEDFNKLAKTILKMESL